MFIVGIGGTFSPSSSSERALVATLAAAGDLCAWTTLFNGEFLKRLPLYDPASPARSDDAQELIGALRHADGVVISSAAYHGSVSGALKNALDYTQDLAADERPYLSGRPVGLISLGSGWQGAVNNLGALRTITHSLRGWPTPYGCVINTDPAVSSGDPISANASQLALVAGEVVNAAGRLCPEPVALSG